MHPASLSPQVVEVSRNVDFDAIYTSGATLEPLLQRFGRVNRLGLRPPADVVVQMPHYPAQDTETTLTSGPTESTKPNRPGSP